MFTNKNKLIGFIALIVVIVLIASAAIALIADGANKKATAEAEKKIEELNQTIETLNNALNGANTNIEAAKTALDALKTQLAATNTALDKAEEMIEKYEALIAAWEKATPEVHTHVTNLQAATTEALNSVKYLPEADRKGNEEKIWNAYYVAYYTILRSGSVEEMKGVVDNFVAETEEINKNRPDRVLDALIAGLVRDEETGKVVYSTENKVQLDKIDAYWAENKDVIEQIMNDASIVKPEDKKDYGNVIIPGLHDEYQDAHIAALEAAFIAAVDAIELPISLETNFDDADDKWTALEAALTEYNKTASQAATDKKALLEEYRALQAKIQVAKDAADLINAEIAAVEVKATVAVGAELAGITAKAENWKTTYETEELAEYVAGFLNEADLTAKNDAYKAAIEALRAEYEAFKAAVNAIGDVTVDSKADIDAADAAYAKVSNPAEADALLELTGDDTIGALCAKLEAARAAYEALVDLINRIRAEIDRLYAADPNVTHEEVEALDALVEELTAKHDINVLNTDAVDYVARLATVRLIPAKNDAIANIHKIYNQYYDANENESRDILIKLANSYAEQKTKVNELTSLEEITERGSDAYIKALFDACLTAEK